MKRPSRNARQWIYIGVLFILVGVIDDHIHSIGLVGTLFAAAVAMTSFIDRDWSRPLIAWFWPFEFRRYVSDAGRGPN